MNTGQLVARLWRSFSEHDWAAARAVLADSFVCDWPQTGERFPDAESFIAMNRAHPAPNWRIEDIDVLQGTDGRASARVTVPTDTGIDVCLGWYVSSAHRLTGAVEYWTEHAGRPIPIWRASWATRIPTDSPGR